MVESFLKSLISRLVEERIAEDPSEAWRLVEEWSEKKLSLNQQQGDVIAQITGPGQFEWTGQDDLVPKD